MDIIKLKSALISTVLMALLTTLAYVVSQGDIFTLDYKALANVGVMSLFTGIVSLIKNYLTKPDGTIGGVKIK